MTWTKPQKILLDLYHAKREELARKYPYYYVFTREYDIMDKTMWDAIRALNPKPKSQ